MSNCFNVLEVITGSMFSGKSEELIRRLRRAKYAKQNIIVFKHHSDNRYDNINVSSHNKNMIEAIPINSSKELINILKEKEKENKIDVIGIDEIQFFDFEILKVIENLVESGKRVIVAGLDQDYNGKPFSFMGELLAMADYVDKLHAICSVCGKEASKTQILKKDKIKNSNILIGSEDIYEARCRKCHKKEI